MKCKVDFGASRATRIATIVLMKDSGGKPRPFLSSPACVYFYTVTTAYYSLEN